MNNPPINGPTATAIAPPAVTMPYARGRSALTKFEATRDTMAGITSAAPTPSRNDHPNSSTGRFGDSAVVNEPHA